MTYPMRLPMRPYVKSIDGFRTWWRSADRVSHRRPGASSPLQDQHDDEEDPLNDVASSPCSTSRRTRSRKLPPQRAQHADRLRRQDVLRHIRPGASTSASRAPAHQRRNGEYRHRDRDPSLGRGATIYHIGTRRRDVLRHLRPGASTSASRAETTLERMLLLHTKADRIHLNSELCKPFKYTRTLHIRSNRGKSHTW